MFEELNAKLQNNTRFIAIIDSDEFYFQKGQEAINTWLTLEIPETQKLLLLGLSSNYEKFSFISETNHPELIEIKTLIHKVISYCDEKARNKTLYNEYNDHRTLARAGVRMGPWVKYLVDYKFNRQNVSGSLKNAFDYLIDPANNSTILSENHREIIINHYLSKQYQPEIFISDLKEIFEPYNLSTKNENNYTNLLSEIIYAYESDWKPEKIITFKEFIEQLKKYKSENDVNFNLLPHNGKSKFIWLSDKDSVIGCSLAHFEVSTRGITGNKDTIYVDVHFESNKKQYRDLFSQSIAELPEDLEWIDWYKSKSIGFKESFKLNDDNLLEKIFNAIEYIDETIGDRIRSIINTVPPSKDKLVNSNGNNSENMESPLNQILFGPPGTGKTFNTINEALHIVDPTYYKNNKGDRKKLTDRFKELLIKGENDKKGQIGFCTFHQSFSYEDFVEGIKPKTTKDKSVYYDIEPGIFKRICELAESRNSVDSIKKRGVFSWTDDSFKKARFFKISLNNYENSNTNELYENFITNNCIAINLGGNFDYNKLTESKVENKFKELRLKESDSHELNSFIHLLKKNNYVIISKDNKYIDAIGKVTGDYEYKPTSSINCNHIRKVEWLIKDEKIPVEEIYSLGDLGEKTISAIDEEKIKPDFFTNMGQVTIDNSNSEDKKFVLIIDEINRGNVSSIFGELITLIEKDKRAGCPEELEIILPYSKEPFKVPKNVYIIGTMNTADRSIEALDTALRRRFSFTEKPPKPELIKTEGLSGELKGIVKVIVNGVEKDVDLESLLIKINTRLEKLIDKDHKIGHSYLLKVNSEETLKASFRNEIIPLLEEYFFGDYGKIGLVLGNTFVELINHAFDFASFDEYDTDIQSDLKEKKVFRIAAETNWDFSKI
jgi:5-methylcytosine-specific restriction endonuclease McrBC GTP-binding regulatory subunit McrB